MYSRTFIVTPYVVTCVEVMKHFDFVIRVGILRTGACPIFKHSYRTRGVLVSLNARHFRVKMEARNQLKPSS
jgi:hypothetical protein